MKLTFHAKSTIYCGSGILCLHLLGSTGLDNLRVTVGSGGRGLTKAVVLRVLNTPNTELIGRGLARYDLNGCNLSGASLAGLDLSSADLSQADFTEADLAGANLSGADLYRSRLCGAVLIGADLSHADLTLADLHGANLSGADLSGATLSGGTLTDADLSDAVLTTTDFYEADLSRVNLAGADLRGANLSCTKMERPKKFDLGKVKLAGNDFTETPTSVTTSTNFYSDLLNLLDKILIFVVWVRIGLQTWLSFKDRAASWQQFPRSQIAGAEVSDPRQELNITKQNLMNSCRGDTNSPFEQQIEEALHSISSIDEMGGLWVQNRF